MCEDLKVSSRESGKGSESSQFQTVGSIPSFSNSAARSGDRLRARTLSLAEVQRLAIR